MTFLLFNRALLRGMLASAVVLAGSACSRSDRTESGSDASAHAETAPPSDNDAAGYRPMERDTTNVPSQPADSASPDTSISGIPESTDTAAIEASAEVADTNLTEMAGATDAAVTADVIAVADSADTAATDVAVGVDSADTTDNAGRIRPPEDSTENLGNITTPDEAADETADEQIVTPEDQETVAVSETPTDEVGAAAVSSDVTGAEAVALMGREGVRCALVDPEVDEAVRWDMSSTPVTLNPCGMGSMVLSRIWTAGQ